MTSLALSRLSAPSVVAEVVVTVQIEADDELHYAEQLLELRESITGTHYIKDIKVTRQPT